MQPFANAKWQTPQHRHLGHVGGHDPDQRTGVAKRLKQRERAAATTLGLVHTGAVQGEGITRGGLKPHLLARPPRRSAAYHPAKAFVVAVPQVRALSATVSTPRAW